MDLKIIAVIKALLLPPTSLLLLGLLGMMVRERKLGGALLFVGVCGLALLSVPAFVKLWAKSWESVAPLQEERILQDKPQAIVVLGGGLKHSGHGVVLGEGTLLRVLYGAQLARKTKLPLLLSGGGKQEKNLVAETELMALFLLQNFDIGAVWQESESRNTAENAQNSFKILDRENIRRIVLVTQAYHMPRALVEFEKQGLVVSPAPTDFISSDESWDIFSFIPSADALGKSYLLAHEWLGLYWYKVRY